MPAVVRRGDFCSGHPGYPARPNLEGSPDVFVNGLAVNRLGDAWAIHGGLFPNLPHAGTTFTGAPTVFCNGRPVARIGDHVSPPCLSTAAHGSPTVFCG
jgi:uncharacterized Zn-binding protein involved in type VI secretion